MSSIADDPAAVPPAARDPAVLLEHTRHQWGGRGDLWLFGYASLIWRPEFVPDEQRPAIVYGYHRALRMRSRVNRGTPANPGLVFALIGGGSCSGVVYRVAHARATAVLDQLWLREMPTGVYTPRWLAARTPVGAVRALAFTLERSSPNFTGPIDDAQMIEVLRQARGRYGTTLDYLIDTARGLRERGIRDREIERLVQLAQRHGLA
jgi:cation transport protein ChaC